MYENLRIQSITLKVAMFSIELILQVHIFNLPNILVLLDERIQIHIMNAFGGIDIYKNIVMRSSRENFRSSFETR